MFAFAPPKPRIPGTAHYATLGVAPSASAADIKRAYMKKARETHPDSASKSSSVDDEAFKALTAAYQVLSDPEKRAAYDRAGDDGVKELEMMGGGGRRAMVPPVHARVSVTFADVMVGVEKTVTYQRQYHGAAEIRTASVYVPKGQVPDVPVTLTSEGHDGVGDVLVTVDIPQSDGVFTRNGGCDLAFKAVIPLWRALVGGPIDIPPLPGDAAALQVFLPTDRVLKSGDEFEIPGRGFPMFGSPDTRGSLLVVLEIDMTVPAHVSREQVLMAATSLGAPAYAVIPTALHPHEGSVSLERISHEGMQRRRQFMQNAVRQQMEEMSGGGPAMHGMFPPGVHMQQVQCAQQ